MGWLVKDPRDIAHILRTQAWYVILRFSHDEYVWRGLFLDLYKAFILSLTLKFELVADCAQRFI